MTFLIDIIEATFRDATPLVYGTVGETYTERAGVLNLGIEGTMYAGAFFGFAVAYQTGDPWLGLAAAVVVGLIAGAIMGLLTVTLGANQHVSGLGLTIGAHRRLRVRQPAALQRLQPGAHRAHAHLGPTGRPR